VVGEETGSTRETGGGREVWGNRGDGAVIREYVPEEAWREYHELMGKEAQARANARVKPTKRGTDSLVWKVHTEFHWSVWIDGKQLNYWPTKSKWRYKDRTQTGDVEEFIRSIGGYVPALPGEEE
jgi:hypothetical protein